jgi:hypothetical protein
VFLVLTNKRASGEAVFGNPGTSYSREGDTRVECKLP